MPRPDRLVAVVGTATGVGKTWAAAAVASALRAGGVAVAARKPVQSYEPGEGPTDADVLAAATGEAADDVCPRHRWYGVAMAPPMAAEALGRPPFTVDELVAEVEWPGGVHVGLVETVGGPRSPVAADGDSVALAAATAPDLVVLVGDAGLGAVNSVRLSAAALPDGPFVVFLNRYDDGCELHRRNAAWLAADGLAVVTTVEELAACAG